ncbi:hypothetical protein GGF31_002887 [Allomyces arbusculus]|nr:hypothetical protein GGF31_002887 [Allomyces arbusculus]
MAAATPRAHVATAASASRRTALPAVLARYASDDDSDHGDDSNATTTSDADHDAGIAIPAVVTAAPAPAPPRPASAPTRPASRTGQWPVHVRIPLARRESWPAALATTANAIVADLIAAVGEKVPFQALLGPAPGNPARSDSPATDWAARWTPHMSLTRAGPAVKRFQMRSVVDAMAARIATAAPAPFTVQLGTLALRRNADGTRVFLCLDAVAGTPKLRAIHRAVDAALHAFRQSAASGALRADEKPPTDEHAFHVSIAWAPIDAEVEEVVPRDVLDAIARRHAAGLWAHLLTVDCVEVSVGHVEHTIWLGGTQRRP